MTKAGERILRAAREALAFAKGEALEGFVVNTPEAIVVKLSQDQFARSFGLPKRTIQDWEQGRRQLQGAARVLLKVIEKEPAAVRRALAAA
jgi:putative transcriptional regulator